jgi:hypothetical protein
MTSSVVDFLGMFVPPDADGFLELRAKPQPGPREFVRLSSAKAPVQLVGYLAQASEFDLYFGVAERRTDENGKKTNLARLRVLWADIDFKTTPKDDADALLDELAARGFPATALVASGRGLHAYWRLKEAADLADGAIARVEALARRLAVAVRGDLASTDATRVLRVPGTKNLKQTPALDVELTAFHPERAYSLEDFEERAGLPADPDAEKHARRTEAQRLRSLGLADESRSLGVQNMDTAVALLAEHWPPRETCRHDFARAIGGWCATSGVALDAAVDLMDRVCEAAGDDEPRDRVRAVEDSYAHHEGGGNVAGIGTALQLAPSLRPAEARLKDALGIVPCPSTAEEATPAPDVSTGDTDLALPVEARLGIAALYAAAYEAPWANWYFAFLTHLGARVAKHVRLDGDDTGTEPRLYSILLAPSSVGKSVPIGKAADDFRYADLGREPDPAKDGSGLVVHGVGSGEALGEAIAEHTQRLALYQPDEFVHTMAKASIDNSSLIPALLTLFDRGVWDNRTKGKKYRIESASLSVLTACVDTVFPRLFDAKTGADQGIINRLWIVAGRPSDTPQAIPRVDRGRRADLRLALHRLLLPFQNMGTADRVLVRMTPDAEQMYLTWYREEYFTKREHSAMQRMRTYAPRLVMLLALASSSEAVRAGMTLTAGPDVVGAAVALCRWQYAVRRRYAPILADNASARVEQDIVRAAKTAGEQGATRRMLQKKTHAERVGVERWSKAFEAVVRNGNIVPLDSPGFAPVRPAPGRPAVPPRWVFSFDFESDAVAEVGAKVAS